MEMLAPVGEMAADAKLGPSPIHFEATRGLIIQQIGPWLPGGGHVLVVNPIGQVLCRNKEIPG